jgi:hypothetical protein
LDNPPLKPVVAQREGEGDGGWENPIKRSRVNAQSNLSPPTTASQVPPEGTSTTTLARGAALATARRHDALLRPSRSYHRSPAFTPDHHWRLGPLSPCQGPVVAAARGSGDRSGRAGGAREAPWWHSGEHHERGREPVLL